MQFTSTTALVGLLALVSNSYAHLHLQTPAPFPGYNSGPMGKQPDGVTFNPFPCQGKMTGGTATTIKLGSGGNKLNFRGSAVHSGGSCQVSLTYEANPTEKTVWKVVTSFHGGCPIKFEGNMPANPEALLDSNLSYDVPENIPAGDAKLAWTWINRTGNREFYMQCAPVMLDGKGGDKKNFDSLPDMVVANVDGFPCKTEEGKNYKYKNPGQSVRTAEGLEFTTLECGAGGGGGDGGDNKSSPTPAPGPDPDPAPVVTNPAPTVSSSGSCTPGAFQCDGPTKFQMCANGAWSVAQSVATGTKCDQGKITKRSERLHMRDFEKMHVY